MKGMLPLVIQNLRRDKRNSIYCAFGIALGVGMFAFFLALSGGIQEEVLNRIYPINQLEMEPKKVSFLGLKENVGPENISPEMIEMAASIEGVSDVSPKMKSHFRARLFGGKAIFGDILRAEAFFDGLPIELGQKELPDDAQESFQDMGEFVGCSTNSQCGERGVCLQGQCWSRSCLNSDECAGGQVCVPAFCSTNMECGGEEELCVEGLCEKGFCAESCKAKVELRETGCGLGQQCVELDCESQKDCGEGPCVDGTCARGYCELMTCELEYPKAQFSLGEVGRGDVDLDCHGDECAEMENCPEGTYCIAENRDETAGHCEVPIPVILSPFLIEVFDLAVANALNLEKLGGGERVLGLTFQVQYGNSYLGATRHSTEQVTKKAKVVGFSEKAMDLGLTVPLPYLQRANNLYGDGVLESGYDSIVVNVEENGSVQGVLAELADMGFEANPRTREAESAASLLFWMTFAFSGVSWLILLVAALHVSQTFHMNVTRRYREMGILRSIGATGRDLRHLVILEASIVGGTGGVLGVVVSFLIAGGLEMLVLTSNSIMKYRPDGLFEFSWSICGAGILVGLVFSALGAWGPSSRASRLDPAMVTK